MRAVILFFSFVLKVTCESFRAAASEGRDGSNRPEEQCARFDEIRSVAKFQDRKTLLEIETRFTDA